MYDRRVDEHGSRIGESARERDVESARAAWRAAASFADLCALGAAFVGGRCAHFPGWGARETDDETDAIREALVALHARGFLSVASQPAFDGTRDGRRVRQRAFVAGFARAELARRWADSPRIAVRAWSAHDAFRSTLGEDDVDEPAAMTTVDGVARVVAGHAARDDELGIFVDDVGADAFRELGETTYVAAWDEEYGRERELWDELIRRADA